MAMTATSSITKSNGIAQRPKAKRSQQTPGVEREKNEKKNKINCFNFEHKINMRPNKLSEFRVYVCLSASAYVFACVCVSAPAQ